MTVLGKARKTKNPATLDNYAEEEREEWEKIERRHDAFRESKGY